MKRSSGRYRGSRRGGGGIIIPVLIALCIASAVTLYVINNNMTFTRDGSFLFPEKEKAPERVESNLVIEEENPAAEETIAVAPPAESESTDSSSMRAMFIPIGSVKNADLFAAELNAAAQKKIDTLVLEVKAEDGTLAFATETKIGQSTLLAGDNEVFLQNLKLARESGYKIAFYLSCFKDNEAARRNQEYSVRTENEIIWLDGENVRWLSAYSENARGYLTALIKELQTFSPDEFILSNISFPMFGKTEIIAYPDGGKEKSAMLASFIREAFDAAGETKLSAVYENYSGEYLKRSGQKKEDFAEFEKLYISRKGSEIRVPLSETDFEGVTIVPIETDATDGDFLIMK